MTFSLWFFLALISLVTLRPQEIDTSHAEKSHTRRETSESDVSTASSTTPDAQKRASGISQKPVKNKRKVTRVSTSTLNGKAIQYKATQVLTRSDADPTKTLPIGSSAIGKTLNAIDTRNPNGLVKVILPYGFSYKRNRRIPKNSILIGTASYGGSGEKVYINFQRGIYPDGTEFKLNGQALNAGDFSPGLIGNHHSNADVRIATTLGLSMVSGMTNVMVEKEALGEGGVVTAKSSVRNGVLNGIANVSEREAERQAQALNGEQEYVTLESGKELIVGLTETFKGESF